jgi:hypothetical protein
MDTMIMHDYEKIKSSGDFDLYVDHPIYQIVSAGDGYHIIDAATKETVGTKAFLRILSFDEDGYPLKTKVYDDLSKYSIVKDEDTK